MIYRAFHSFISICFQKFHLLKYLIFQLLLISASLKSEGFIAGTKVWAYKNNAPMLASIEDLQPGDFCFSQELESGKIEAVKIIEVFKKKIATVTLKLLSLKNLEKAQDLTGLLAETITMSTDHKLFVPTIVDRKLVGEWTTASEIKAGTLLMFGGADSVFLQDILVLVSQADISSEEEVYCLSLAKNHNYFVSELGIIVHNFVPLFVGLSFAFGGGEIVLTGLTATAILGGLFFGASTMKDNGGDLSLKGHGGIVTESRKTPPSSSAGGSPGGPKPPKKDDDGKDKDNKKCSNCKRSETTNGISSPSETCKASEMSTSDKLALAGFLIAAEDKCEKVYGQAKEYFSPDKTSAVNNEPSTVQNSQSQTEEKPSDNKGK